jgi:hypothetical protein
MDAAWIGPGGVLQAAEHDCHESENPDPGADDALRAHLRGLLSWQNIGQKRPIN